MPGNKTKKQLPKSNSKKLVAKPNAPRLKVEMAPVAYASKSKTKNASINYSRDGKSCVITHRERFATILGSTGFASTSFAINPGQSASFPWLSGIANRFESYRFEKLAFEFKTKTATTALGDVILAVDYDATDAAPTDSIQAEAYDESVSSAPWQNVTHVCKHSNMRKLPTYYVRGDTQPSATDLKLSDMGNLFVCTENQASAALVGYMYVSYTISLLTPQLRSNDISISGGKLTGATSMTAANPFGTAAAWDASARGVSVNTASRITFTNPGTYVCSVILAGSVLSATTVTDGAGLTSTSVSGIANGAATTFVHIFYVVTTVANAYFDYTATATTVTTALLYVGSAPYAALALDQMQRALSESPVYRSGVPLGPSRSACVERIHLRNDGCEARCPPGCWCSSLCYAQPQVTGVNQITPGAAKPY